jgi:hypothetical protein
MSNGTSGISTLAQDFEVFAKLQPPGGTQAKNPQLAQLDIAMAEAGLSTGGAVEEQWELPGWVKDIYDAAKKAYDTGKQLGLYSEGPGAAVELQWGIPGWIKDIYDTGEDIYDAGKKVYDAGKKLGLYSEGPGGAAELQWGIPGWVKGIYDAGKKAYETGKDIYDTGKKLGLYSEGPEAQVDAQFLDTFLRSQVQDLIAKLREYVNRYGNLVECVPLVTKCVEQFGAGQYGSALSTGYQAYSCISSKI